MIELPSEIEQIAVEKLIPYARNSRTHDDAQVAQIAASIKEWMKIGDYAVSRCGVIIALPAEYRNRWGGVSVRPARVLAQSNDQDGYKLTTMRRLGLSANGQVRVHRLVALCWIGKCPEGYEVNHKDGNKANNHADNLEYVTSKQNKAHALSLGLMKKGRLNCRTKPMRVWNGLEEKVLYGLEDMVRHGFRPQSMHAVANGYRKSCHGWRAEYI